MKTIHTLIIDIQYLLKQRGWLTPVMEADLGHQVASRFRQQFEPRPTPKLRLSRMGPVCPCALWHSIHNPHLEQKAEGWAEFKWSFGHTIEAKAIFLAKAAGHLVTGEQDEVSVDGITGHRDLVLDGCIVDVKSASSRSFLDFKTRNVQKLDNWGYLDQLDGYLTGSLNDPLVQVKDRAYLLAIDLQLGHMYLYEHHLREERIRQRIRDYKQIIQRDTPPPCECITIADGKSGNIKLDVKASYNSFKYACKPHLRTFLYADGPRYLTKVVYEPDVTEVNKYGQIIYR